MTPIINLQTTVASVIQGIHLYRDDYPEVSRLIQKWTKTKPKDWCRILLVLQKISESLLIGQRDKPIQMIHRLNVKDLCDLVGWEYKSGLKTETDLVNLYNSMIYGYQKWNRAQGKQSQERYRRENVDHDKTNHDQLSLFE